MHPQTPTIDSDAEASHVSIQPTPGAVFLRLRRERGGRATRRMFVEMTVGEAIALRRELDESIRVALAAEAR